MIISMRWSTLSVPLRPSSNEDMSKETKYTTFHHRDAANCFRIAMHKSEVSTPCLSCFHISSRGDVKFVYEQYRQINQYNQMSYMDISNAIAIIN